MTRARSGYSLVELLVVLALMGLIAIAISGGMRFGTRVWERTERTVDNLDLARAEHTALRALLSHIYPRRENSSDVITFTGAADLMEFDALAPSQFGATGITRFTLSVERTADGRSLALSYKSEGGPNAEERHVVLSGASDITFAYAKASNEEVAWSADWQGQPTPPALIRVRAAFPPHSGLHWPELVVRPLIDRDAGCIFDPVSFRCRRG